MYPNCSSVGCLKCVQFHNWMLGLSLRAGGQRSSPAAWLWVWLLSYFHRTQEKSRTKRNSQLFNFPPANWLHVHVQCLATFFWWRPTKIFFCPTKMVSEWDIIILCPFKRKKLFARKISEVTCHYKSLELPRTEQSNEHPWGLVHCRSGFKKLLFVPVSEKYPMCPEHDQWKYRCSWKMVQEGWQQG